MSDNKCNPNVEESSASQTDKNTKWALRERADEYGNVTCAKCGKVQADSFGACIQCCSHDELIFDEEWNHGWRLTVACAICGKDFDFSNDVVMREYKAVRISPNVETMDRAPNANQIT